MEETHFYYKFADNSAERISTNGAVPPTPPGATPITEAEYNALVTAARNARATANAARRAADDAARRRRQNSPDVLVAAATATQAVKDTAAYVCDGTDDYVQLNQARAEALTAGGGTVRLSPGTFHLGADSLHIPEGSGLRVVGSGRSTVLKVSPGTNRYAVVFDGPGETRADFADMVIDGSRLDQTTGGGCVWAPGAVQCHFDNVHFTQFWEYGIHFGPMTGGAFGHTNYVTNCLFDNTMGHAGAGTALHFTSNDENFITACDFEFLGGDGAVATAVYDQSGTQFLTGCNFVNGAAGKPVVRVQNAHNTRVVGCNYDGVGGDGVFISGSGCTVTANTFFGVGILGTPGTVSGIHLEFASTDNVISANVMATHTADGAAHSLIREDGDGDAGGNSITGNQLIQRGTAAFGLLALNGIGSTVRDNTGAPNGDDIPPATVIAGPVSDASFPANRIPPVGTLAYDSVNSALYIRTGAGAWKSVTVA